MSTITSPYYRLHRPEIPLLALVRQQSGLVIVHKRDLASLTSEANVESLPHGGPQPGEVWLPLPVEQIRDISPVLDLSGPMSF